MISAQPHSKCAGFGLLEVLVAMVILLSGLLGLAGLLTRSQQLEMESYQRAQALILLQDMVGRINANRKVAACYAITTNATSGTPYLGSNSSVTPACSSGTTAQYARANADLTAWHNLLSGSAEIQGSTNVGAMIGARGCIRNIATNTYLILVTWQGLGKTVSPSVNLACANTTYGDEAQRRVVSTTVNIANLL